MATVSDIVPMPRLSDSMEFGVVSQWLVRDGQPVRRGELIVEIETDKATVPFEAPTDGFVRHLLRAGDTARVGAPIAENHSEPVGAASSVAASHGDRPGGVSPLARRAARQLGIPIDGLIGSGPRGRVMKRDVQHAAPTLAGPSGPRFEQSVTVSPEPPSASPVGVPPAAAATGKGSVTKLTLSRIQLLGARRVTETKLTIPDFSVSIEIDMSEASALRKRLESSARAKPTINDMVIKASALALRDHPELNASYEDGAIEIYGRVNIGVAVAVGDTLIVPTVMDADQLSLGAIAERTRGLAEAARSGVVTPEELSSGTFTVSNLGMYGVSAFAPIINAPQAAILAVGGTRTRPRFNSDGQVVAAQVMTVTIVCDHRAVQGAQAAQFLASLQARLESPLELVL